MLSSDCAREDPSTHHSIRNPSPILYRDPFRAGTYISDGMKEVHSLIILAAQADTRHEMLSGPPGPISALYLCSIVGHSTLIIDTIPSSRVRQKMVNTLTFRILDDPFDPEIPYHWALVGMKEVNNPCCTVHSQLANALI